MFISIFLLRQLSRRCKLLSFFLAFTMTKFRRKFALLKRLSWKVIRKLRGSSLSHILNHLEMPMFNTWGLSPEHCYEFYFYVMLPLQPERKAWHPVSCTFFTLSQHENEPRYSFWTQIMWPHPEYFLPEGYHEVTVNSCLAAGRF